MTLAEASTAFGPTAGAIIWMWWITRSAKKSDNVDPALELLRRLEGKIDAIERAVDKGVTMLADNTSMTRDNRDMLRDVNKELTRPPTVGKPR